MMPAAELRRIADRELACTVPPTSHRLAQGVIDLLDANAALTAERDAARAALSISRGTSLLPGASFAEAWAAKAVEGYQYGAGALKRVEFGWDIATAHYQPTVAALTASLAHATDELTRIRDQQDAEIERLKTEIEEWRAKARHEYERMGG